MRLNDAIITQSLNAERYFLSFDVFPHGFQKFLKPNIQCCEILKKLEYKMK